MKILVIEDSWVQLNLLLKFLAKIGLTEVETAENVESAKSIIKSNSLDLIVSDINYPGGGAREVQDYVRGTLSLNVPILLMSDKDEYSEIFHLIKNGANGYFFKPINMKSVQQALENLKLI